MSINVKKIGSQYFAEVTPPHGGGSYWKNDEGMSAKELIKKLIELGCHQQDIGDAFDEADPQWLQHN